jgi:hypothetical protein
VWSKGAKEMIEEKWSKKEKSVARRAFENAYEKECTGIITKMRKMAKEATKPEHIWQLHDFLTEKRNEIDYKYDYRYSVLISVFARLIREGWMKLDDLEDLREEKIHKIKHVLSR